MQATPALSEQCAFERAYCMYRSHRHKEALQVLGSSSPSAGTLMLEAQILYRMASFEEVAAVYERLRKVCRNLVRLLTSLNKRDLLSS